MTQDELRIEEATQSIRLSMKEHAAQWASEALQEVMEAHRSRLLQPTDTVEARRALLKKSLEEAVNHRIKRKMLVVAMEQVAETKLFAKEELLAIQQDANRSFDSLFVTIPVEPLKSRPILEPIRMSLTVFFFGFVGIFFGNQITNDHSIPLLSCLLMSALGAFFLTVLQKKVIHEPLGSSLQHRLFRVLSIDTVSTTDWLSVPKQQTEEQIAALGQVLALLVQYAALLQLQKQEERTEETDLLQHLFTKCIDGFSEAYYAEKKHDPERALDATIKLMGDFANAGISIEMIERGTPFAPEFERLFDVSGRIQEGEPVLTIFPAWQWKGRLLAKGTLKRAKNRGKS